MGSVHTCSLNGPHPEVPYRVSTLFFDPQLKQSALIEDSSNAIIYVTPPPTPPKRDIVYGASIGWNTVSPIYYGENGVLYFYHSDNNGVFLLDNHNNLSFLAQSSRRNAVRAPVFYKRSYWNKILIKILGTSLQYDYETKKTIVRQPTRVPTVHATLCDIASMWSVSRRT